MRTLKIIYIVLIVVALATVGYNYLEVQPVLQHFSNAEGLFNMAVYSDARAMSDILGIAGTCLGGIGAIMAAIAYFKTKGGMHLLFALIGVVVAIAAFMISFGRVI